MGPVGMFTRLRLGKNALWIWLSLGDYVGLSILLPGQGAGSCDCLVCREHSLFDQGLQRVWPPSFSVEEVV